MVATASRRRVLLPIVLGGVAALATDWGYLSLLRDQAATPPNAGIVPFVAGYIAALAAAAALGAALVLAGRRRAAEVVLVGAGGGAAALGILAIFSIGLALLITAALLVIGACGVAPPHHGWKNRALPMLSVVVAVGVIVIGFAVNPA